MAKIRVYELARDLNMKNKELLDKLEELNITVRSHMSSLDDDTVAEIKASLRDKKKPGGLEVTRVKPTVIRRRKRASDQAETQVEGDVETQAATPEQAQTQEPVLESESARQPEPAAEPDDFEQRETAVETDVDQRPETLEISEEQPGPSEVEQEKPVEVEETEMNGHAEPEKEDSAEKPVEQPKASEAKKRRKKKKKKDEFVARIISKPESPRPETPRPDDQAAEKIEAEKEKVLAEEKPAKLPETGEESAEKPSGQEIPAPEAVAQEPEAMVVAGKAEEPEKTEMIEPHEAEKKKEAAAAGEAQPDEAVSSVDAKAPEKAPSEETPEKGKKTKAKAKPPKKKKGKKETPAKIIQLPTKPVQPLTEAGPAEQEGPSAQGYANNTEPQENTSDAESDKFRGRAKKKRGKQVDMEDKEKRFFKKKGGFKRKEVVEGSALYGPKGRKGKKGGKAKVAKGQKTQITTPKAIKRRIKIDDAIVLADLAKRMGIKASDMIAKLMGLGVMATVNQTIDYDTAVLVASEFGYGVEKAAFEEEAILKVQQDESGEMQWRPPVVTIMGHVDHGKTSLLDVIRKTRITEGEAGGITQHIGAYHVETDRGNVVFLDTPGHEAFTAMRARGAQVTDIVVLVVAADDGVMPQTVEAINHSKASGVPIIVAVNKIDKNNAEPDKVQRQLAELGLVPEEWGGDTIYVKVSAKKNIGIDDLLEMILLQSEILELQANPDKLAIGHVIEAKLDAGRGPVATVLVTEGTLTAGAPVVCGVHYGKIRAMLNDRGQSVDSAGPAMPVEILGLTGVPEAGDELVALTDEKDAKHVSEHRTQKQRSIELAKTSRLSLEKLYERMQEGEVKELNLIIKADVHGSIEALKDSLIKLSNDEVKIVVNHAATGTITESDVSLAAVSNAIIIGFNVRPSPKVVEYAQEEHVEMKFYNVIYNAIKDVKDAIVGMMDSTFEERTLGRAEVRETFNVPKVGTIAGSYVTDGTIERNKLARLVRDGVVIFEGKISSLRRFKDDTKEVHSGYECGIGLENYNDIKIGDVLECYYLEEIKPELE